ncbi:MAG: hypothetical protein R2681_11120 [Pyrinomonadaceae bacterium]
MKNTNFALKLYSVTLTLILAFLLFSGFKFSDSEKTFDEITVKRINVVEPDGKLKMVISNKTSQHPGMLDGNEFPQRERPPGIIFFNEEQDEVGGLVYRGNKDEGASLVFSVDQYKNDQVMQMQLNSKENGDNRYGLQIWERDKKLSMPKLQETIDMLEKKGFNYQQKLEYLKEQNGGEPIVAPRMFVGKDYDRATGMFIRDKYGVERLRVYVDSNNEPKVEVYDSTGKLIRDLLDK